MNSGKRMLLLVILLIPAVGLVVYFGFFSAESGQETAENLGRAVEEAGRNINTVERELNPVSEEEERRAGRRLRKQVQRSFRVLPDGDARTKYVRSLGKIIVHSGLEKDFTYEFAVIQHPMINAFALPGGFIYVTTGMMDVVENEAELAGVLAHEVGHVETGHTADLVRGGSGRKEKLGLEKMVRVLIRKSYDQAQEREADLYSIDCLIDAGYVPYAMGDLFERLAGDGSKRNDTGENDQDTGHRSPSELAEDALDRYLATHPDPSKRAAYIRSEGRKRARQVKRNRFYRGAWNIKNLQTGKKEDESEWIKVPDSGEKDK